MNLVVRIYSDSTLCSLSVELSSVSCLENWWVPWDLIMFLLWITWLWSSFGIKIFHFLQDYSIRLHQDLGHKFCKIRNWFFTRQIKILPRLRVDWRLGVAVRKLNYCLASVWYLKETVSVLWWTTDVEKMKKRKYSVNLKS
jgi:hypothetical protein